MSRDVIAVFEALFSGGPDTVCRTTWREEPGLFGETYRVECVEVPMDELRAAFADAQPHPETDPSP